MNRTNELNDRERYLERPLPNSPESERCIIGAIILDSKADGTCDSLETAMSLISPDDFYSTFYRRVYEAQSVIYKNKKRIDPILIGEELKKEGVLDSSGGIAAIANLMYGLPQFADISEYCRIVNRKSRLRQRIKVCNDVVNQCLAEEYDAETVLDQTSALFQNNVETLATTEDGHVSDIETAVAAFNKKITDWKAGKETALPTPYPEINKRLPENGLVLGDLSIIAARPSDGKTTMALHIASHIARHYAPTLFFTLEQSKEKLIQKMLAGLARVPNYRIEKKLFDSSSAQDKIMLDRLRDAMREIKANYKIYFDEDSSSISQILRTAEIMVRKKGIKLIVVDYGQIVKNDLGKTGQTRDRELGQIADELKAFAKKETMQRGKVHVILNLQLKRPTLLKGEKSAPTLEDMRESGNFEAIADSILAPYGDKAKGVSVTREMQIVCLKNRNGRVGWTLPFTLHGDWQKFYDETNIQDDLAAVRASQESFDEESEF